MRYYNNTLIEEEEREIIQQHNGTAIYSVIDYTVYIIYDSVYPSLLQYSNTCIIVYMSITRQSITFLTCVFSIPN